MSTHKHIGRICCLVMAAAVLITVLLLAGLGKGHIGGSSASEYESRIFDTEKVHTIDLVMDTWEEFLENAEAEEYAQCEVTIDGETFNSIGIRAKGNTSLTSVKQYGNNRYSFKLEFDHYSAGNSYYGLDKLNLNNLISDNTYMKDYLCYTMMKDMGVPSPLCSYAYVTVNGKNWGLYLAVEGVEESFLQRNYGTDYGSLYKPDSQSGGTAPDADRKEANKANSAERNGKAGQNSDSSAENDKDSAQNRKGAEPASDWQDNVEFPPGELPEGSRPELPDKAAGDQLPNENSRPEHTDNAPEFQPPDAQDSAQIPGLQNKNRAPGRPENSASPGTADDDVKLQYIDDSWKSYPNIFDNAKTNITAADRKRLIAALKALSDKEEAQTAVDIEEVTAYLAVHNFVCNEDSYTGTMVHNYYLYEKGGILSMIPWDYNLAFGGFTIGSGSKKLDQATAEVNSPIDSPVSGNALAERPMVAWIFQQADCTELYHQQYSKFISRYFEKGDFETTLEQTTSLISPYVKKDPTAFCTYKEYQQGVKTLKNFCLLRAESVAGQLSGEIPSTESEQSQDSTKLVNASSLNLKDMGQFSGSKKQQQD